MEIKLKSPAKINIGLRILSKRKDGFHNIETIFYPLKLTDEIKLKIINSSHNKQAIKIKTIPRGDIDNDKNICYRACTDFFSLFKLKQPNINITIKKKIPVGAGLGGGSSNAACVLKALAEIYNISLKDKRLMNLATSLGSDIPFFISGVPSYAFGKGEKLIPLTDFKIPYRILLVNPKIKIPTSWAYSKIKLPLNRKRIMQKIRKFSPDDKIIKQNHFEKYVFRYYPEIGKIKNDLMNFGALYSLMSGSGSSVYGFFKPNSSKIKLAQRYFESLGYLTFLL